ncbi:MAG: ABC transporter permease, partial [Prevotella sp.]|nr:ABC transporter permease [Prevotella sp.]
MVSIIIRREYLERVKKKSFIFTTILMPILMLGLMVLPTLIMTMTEPDLRNIVVVDGTGQIYSRLKSEANIHYSESEIGKSVDSLLGDEDIDAVLVIPENVMDGNGMMKLYNKNASSLTMETQITSQVNDIIEQHKLSTYDIDNLSAILDAVKSDVTLQNIRADEDGATSESSTGLSYILGILLTFMLYIL